MPGNRYGCASTARSRTTRCCTPVRSTFASDMTLLDAVLSAHGEVWGPGGMVGASLDHALWFHRPFRADQWFLYDCWSPTSYGARGLATGRLFTQDGRHVASATQEGLLRRVGG